MQTEEEQNQESPVDVRAIRRQLGIGLSLLSGAAFNWTELFLPGLTHTAHGMLKLANLALQISASPQPGSLDEQTGAGRPPNGGCTSILEAYGHARKLISDRGYDFLWLTPADLDKPLKQKVLALLDACIDEVGQPAEDKGQTPAEPILSMLRWQNTVDRALYEFVVPLKTKAIFDLQAVTFEQLKLPGSPAELSEPNVFVATLTATQWLGASIVVRPYRAFTLLQIIRFWTELGVDTLNTIQGTTRPYIPSELIPLLDFLQPDEALGNRARWDDSPDKAILNLAREAWQP